MVVVCESCSTRFQVDDTRIPPKGTLVRCSRCKNTFIVKAPQASYEDTVRNVVAEITEAGGMPAPEPAEDLFDRVGEDLGATGTRPAGQADDDAWEFDEEPARKTPAPAPGGGALEGAAPAAARPPLEEIGSPEEWDLLGDSVAATAREATFREAPPPRPEPGSVRAPAPAPAPRVPEVERSRPEREGPRGSQLGRAVASAGRTGAHAIAWLALALLFAAGVAQVVPAGPALVLPAAAPEVVGLPDGEARGVRLRFVENAFVGTLFVVQGELARPSASALIGLRVHWVDGQGTRLGVGAWARGALAARELRERAPEALRQEPAAAVDGPFLAIFDAVPPEATGFELALEPLPPVTKPEAPAATPPAEAAPAGPDPVGPTASSPPSPRPASE